MAYSTGNQFVPINPPKLKFIPSNSERACLLGMPPEIRLHIYKSLRQYHDPHPSNGSLHNVASFDVFDRTDRTWMQPRWNRLDNDLRGMLRVNRLINGEVMAILYNGLVVYLSIKRYRKELKPGRSPPIARMPTLTPRWTLWSYMRGLDVELHMAKESNRRVTIRSATALVKASQSWTGLKSLRLKICPYENVHSPRHYKPDYYQLVFQKLNAIRIETLESVHCTLEFIGGGEMKDELCLKLERTLMSANRE